jgi:myosin-1
VFALTDNAYSDLRFKGRNQCVIISGESGSGKTEASKVIMKYVAAVSPSGAQVDEVKTKLLKTNPVLEAFGNAKTVRNDNSSRFGKYMDIQFDFHGNPVGGNITTYLLEKARIVRQNPDERCFHIFYQLLASNQLNSFQMDGDPTHYRHLNQGKCVKVKGINDQENFREVQVCKICPAYHTCCNSLNT